MRILRQFAWLGLGLGLTLTASAADIASLERAVATEQVVEREQMVDAVIDAINKSTVSSQTSGRITEVLVDVDDYVQKGAVLVRFRDKEQQAALRAAKAQASEAEANFKRVKDLVERKLVPKAEFDKAEAALKGQPPGLSRRRNNWSIPLCGHPTAAL